MLLLVRDQSPFALIIKPLFEWINSSTKRKNDGTPAEGMTLKNVEHLGLENEYVFVKDHQFGEESSIYFAFQEPQVQVGCSENEAMTPSDTKDYQQ